MKRIILGIVCILFSGYAYADVQHPENTDIVGYEIANGVCFNNDGDVVDFRECDGLAVDEGFVIVTSGSWKGKIDSGINGCGVAAVSSGGSLQAAGPGQADRQRHQRSEGRPQRHQGHGGYR